MENRGWRLVAVGLFSHPLRCSCGRPSQHEDRYRRSSEFIQVLRGIWTQSLYSFKGDFYNYIDYNLSPKPLTSDETQPDGTIKKQTGPTIFIGGNSPAAREVAAAHSDWFFMNGNTDEVLRDYIHDVRAKSFAQGRKVKTAIK